MAGSSPFLTDGGLLFGAGNTEFNFAYYQGSYYLFGGESPRPLSPFAAGTATLTAAVPEGGATLALLGAALLVFVAVRRRFVR